MKEVGFMAVAGLISAILTNFLPSVPGLGTTITLIGTIAAVAGGAIGLLFRPLNMSPLIGLIIISLVLAVYSLISFNGVVVGEPGPEAAKWLYLWAALMFLPIGILIKWLALKSQSPKLMKPDVAVQSCHFTRPTYWLCDAVGGHIKQRQVARAGRR